MYSYHIDILLSSILITFKYYDIIVFYSRVIAMLSPCSGHVLGMFGWYLGGAWEVFGVVWEVFGRSLGGLWRGLEAFGRCLGGVWEVFGGCVGGALVMFWQVFGRFSGGGPN